VELYESSNVLRKIPELNVPPIRYSGFEFTRQKAALNIEWHLLIPSIEVNYLLSAAITTREMKLAHITQA